MKERPAYGEHAVGASRRSRLLYQFSKFAQVLRQAQLGAAGPVRLRQVVHRLGMPLCGRKKHTC